MATVPTPMPHQPKAKKQPKPVKDKHSITISFEGKYLELYNQLKSEAEEDDRPLYQYVLRLLHQTRTQPTD